MQKINVIITICER